MQKIELSNEYRLVTDVPSIIQVNCLRNVSMVLGVDEAPDSNVETFFVLSKFDFWTTTDTRKVWMKKNDNNYAYVVVEDV